MADTLGAPRDTKYIWLGLIYAGVGAAGVAWMAGLSAHTGGLLEIPFDAIIAPLTVFVIGLAGVGKCIFRLCKPRTKRDRDRSPSTPKREAFHVQHQLMPGAVWLSRHLSPPVARRLRVFQSLWVFMAPLMTAWLLQFVNSIIIGVSLPGSPPAGASLFSTSVQVLTVTGFLLVYASCLFGFASHKALEHAAESSADHTTPHPRTVVGSQGIDE